MELSAFITSSVRSGEANTPCMSADLESYVKEKLGVDYHGTSSDGKVTLEPVYCLGNCACSPNVRLDDSVHARMDKSKIDELLSKLAVEVVA